MEEYDNQRPRNFSDEVIGTKIVISKLNPEVQEFVPKTIHSTNVSRNDSLDCNPLESFSNGKLSPKTLEEVLITSNNDSTNPNSRKQNLSQEQSKPSHETGKNGGGDCGWVNNKETKDKQFLTQDETKSLDSYVQMYTEDEDKKKMIAMLKEQISKIPKDSSFDKRKDRNVAIAALIKANTIPSPASNLTSSSPSPKTILLTPDYFQGPSTSGNLDAQDQENLVPTPRWLSPKLHKEDNSQNIENVEDNVLEENFTPKLEVARVRTPIDESSVQESINKVNAWFNSPPSPKPPELSQAASSEISKPKSAQPYLGTFMFKKKSVPDRNSPMSDIYVSKSPVFTTPSYVPSKYAQDLAKKFEERNQVKEIHMDIWTKLERDLKIKDEEYRLRIREREAQNSINNASSNNTL